MKSFLCATLVGASLLLLTSASHAQVFEAILSGANESPANASPGTGFATVTFDLIAHTMRVQVSFSDLTGGNTAAHIHSATGTPFAGTAPVATTTPTFPGFPSGVTSGAYDAIMDMTLASSYRAGFITANGGTPATAELALFNGVAANQAYLNIHTANFPSGEIRGFLVAVPEPGSLTLLAGAGALGLVGFAMRRRK